MTLKQIIARIIACTLLTCFLLLAARGIVVLIKYLGWARVRVEIGHSLIFFSAVALLYLTMLGISRLYYWIRDNW